jgi:hypothetical protein
METAEQKRLKRQKELLVREISRLEKDLGAVEDELDKPLEAVRRSQYQDQKAKLLIEIEKAEKAQEECEQCIDPQSAFKLDIPRSTPVQYRQFTTLWDEHLHKIDHAKSKKMTSVILKQFEKRSSQSSLFLFQKHGKFLGKRYIEHLKKTIASSDIGHFSQPYRVGIPEGQPTPIEFLNNLGEQLGIELSPLQEMTVGLILAQIKSVLKGCNIFFIEVNLPDLDGDCEFVSWFMEEFWGQVIDRMPEFLTENKSALFIAVMTMEMDLEKDFLRERSCTPAKFVDGKFVVLQQEKWKEDDIRDWLRKFSRLDLSAEQIEKVPRSIHQIAEGLPFASEIKLLQELERLAG